MGGASNVPVGTLLWTVLEAIIEVFILCSAGYILARVGIADKATQRKLNVINVSLFTPALLFGKIAFSLTPEKLKELWVIPLGFVIVTAVSAAVAWGLGTAMRLSKSQRAYGVACAMFQNSNSLPIALIQSLVDEVPGLKWGKEDTRDAMLGRALTYLVLYSTLGMMLRWSYGVKLLAQADDEAPPVADPLTSAIMTTEPDAMSNQGLLSPQPRPGSIETDPLFSSVPQIKQDEMDESQSARRLSAISATSSTFAWTQGSAHTLQPQGAALDAMRRNSNGGTPLSGSGSKPRSNSIRPRQPTRTESGREFWGLPEAPRTMRALSAQEEEDESDSEDEEQEEEWGDDDLPLIRRRQITPPHTRLSAFFRTARERLKAFWLAIYNFMTMPMWSAVISILIAVIPPLQALLVKSKPLTQAIKGAGQCSIPLTLVVLGAFFYAPPPSQSSSSFSRVTGNGHTGPIALPPSPTLGPTKTPGFFERKASFFERKFKALAHPLTATGDETHKAENRTVFVAVVSRMILVPALLLPILALVARFDLFEAAEDPVFVLAATLIISSPTALTISQLTEAANGLAFERLITKTISWSYAVLTPPLTLLYVVLGLVFARL